MSGNLEYTKKQFLLPVLKINFSIRGLPWKLNKSSYFFLQSALICSSHVLDHLESIDEGVQETLDCHQGLQRNKTIFLHDGFLYLRQ